MDENEVGRVVVDAAVQVHRALGPGLLESVYEVVLAYEVALRGLEVARQVPISIAYKDVTFAEAFRADLFVERRVIVELKCVEYVSNAHKKQLLTYLRLSDCRLGFLLNFSGAVMKSGIIRMVNGLRESPSAQDLE
jgi:GxxExxY protein